MQSSDWQTLVRVGHEALLRRDFARAEENYLAAVQTATDIFGALSSDAALALSELAECYETEGKDDLADESYALMSRIVRSSSDNARGSSSDNARGSNSDNASGSNSF